MNYINVMLTIKKNVGSPQIETSAFLLHETHIGTIRNKPFKLDH